jgi:hypothetical protein
MNDFGSFVCLKAPENLLTMTQVLQHRVFVYILFIILLLVVAAAVVVAVVWWWLW